MNDNGGMGSDTPMKPYLLGPYRVLDRLGAGGMGVVLHAEHIDTGAIVAIKTASSPKDPGHLAALRLEIQTLRRLRHPDIVRLLDADVAADGVPWIAMPRLEGRTLRDHLRALRPTSGGIRLAATLAAPPAEPALEGADRPRDALVASANAPPLGPLLTLIRRLCTPLAYLHGEGFVHRDLKPANIFLQGDDRPVLLDLGIASHFGGAGREELDVDAYGGTPAYMAPEQFEQRVVDARADLYALGCILFECVTGRPPFLGNPCHLRDQHRLAPPLPPSAYVPDLPSALDDLILALLEKDPKDRVQYAADVAMKLVALGAEPEPDPCPRPRPYLYRPVFAGRVDALGTLVEMALQTASQRQGGLALVLGESGSGKTRLVRELYRRVADHPQQPVLLTGSCVAPGAGETTATTAMAAPLHPLRPALLYAIDKARTSRSEAARLFGGRCEVLAAYLPELRALSDDEEPAAPAPLSPTQARRRIVSALRETLRALAEPMPILLFVDDLQWADDLTLTLLEALARDAPDEHTGVLVVATCRVEEMRPELEDLARMPGVTPIRLDKLTVRDVEEMAAGMLSPSLLPEFVRNALIRDANGNPFFVAESLRAALDEGVLRRDATGRFSFAHQGADAPVPLPMPRTLDELLARRLGLLDTEARELAAWAAVLGQELDDVLLLAGPRGEEAVATALGELRARRILEETETGGLRFVHDRLREMAYRRLDDGARAALHRRAGEAIEALHGEAPEMAPVLAHHFAGAGLHGKAGSSFERAAERAVAVYAYRDGVRFYRSAIDALALADAEPARLAKLKENLGDVLTILGWQEMARDAYGGALAVAPSRAGLADLHRKIGKTWEMHHKHAEALERYVQAETALGAEPEPNSNDAEGWWHAWIQIHLDRISVHYWRADRNRLDALIDAVRPVVEQKGTPLHRAHYLHALTQRGILRDRSVASAETVRHAAECVAEYEAAGEAPDGHWPLAARCSLAIVRMLHGDLDQAEAGMDDALSIAQRSGDLEVQTRCMTYLALIHRRRRLTGAAENVATRSLKLAKAERIDEYAGAALGNLAWCALQRGDRTAAEANSREAIRCWEPPALEPLALVYPFQWLARLPLCWVELASGHLEGAVAQARAVLDPRQQRLPGRLSALLAAAVRYFSDGHEARACRTLALALRAARHGGYA
jgi:eukaryotic-like serine/threonine-protein kinase